MEPFCFLHITDTHLVAGSSPTDGLAPGVQRAIERVVASARPRIAFIAHTGDVCGGATLDSLGTGADYEIAAASLGSFGVPLYCAPGNHDDPGLLAAVVPRGPHEPLPGCPASGGYLFRTHGCVGLVLDSRVERQTTGRLSESTLVAVGKVLAREREPVLLFLHHPPVPTGCQWADAVLAIDNGLELHALLAAHSSRVRGVFFGHVHSPVFIVREGVSYVGGPPVAPAFEVAPGLPFARAEGPCDGLEVVLVSEEGIRVFTRVR